MKIDIRNQEQLVIRVVRDLLREDFPVNYNLVVPPGFGEAHLRRQLAEELRSVAGPEGALVAEISPDRFEDAAGYVTELHRQWGIGEQLPTGVSPNAMLTKLLEWIPRDRPAIQLISRFHKIVDCLGRWVLAALRTYEQEHRLRSINLTPLPYSALIRLWEEQTRSVFTVSNYGDGHATEVVEPLPAAGLVERSVAEGLPPGLARFATELTGGYPEPFEVVVAEWHRLNRPELRPETRIRLRSVAVSRLARFAKYLDFGTGSIYRDHVLHLYHAVDTEVALLALGHHPWSSILIEDDRLRAEGLGQAVHDAAIGEVIRAGKIQHAWHTVFDRAVEMYHRRQFASVLRLLDASIGSSNRIEHQLLRHHASIMDCLYRNEGKAQGSGAGWAAIIPAIANAAATLKVYQVQIPHADLIGARYGDLDRVAPSLPPLLPQTSPRTVSSTL